MPRSTKKKVTLAIGNTEQERQQIMDAWREIATIAGFTGRYGGDVSKLMSAIAQLESRDRKRLARFAKKLLQPLDTPN